MPTRSKTFSHINASQSGIVAACMSTGTHFLDPSFPPSERSLFGREGKGSARAREGYGGRGVAVSWKAPDGLKPTRKAAVGVNFNKVIPCLLMIYVASFSGS